MPASSRKRNKGKERKAKKEADKVCGSNQCDHGCAVMISDDHPVSSFMDQFYINLRNQGLVVAEALTELFVTHRHVWNNESYMKIVLDLLIHIGTNELLCEGSDLSGSALCVAQSIITLEHYNDTCDIDLVLSKRVVASKWRDLSINSSERRDALKFFRKRTSCKCLKKMHLEARKQLPKIGQCMNCKVEKERVSLSVCSRCMVERYCSRECQVANWPAHKVDCDAYVKASREGMDDDLLLEDKTLKMKNS